MMDCFLKEYMRSGFGAFGGFTSFQSDCQIYWNQYRPVSSYTAFEDVGNWLKKELSL